jgi:hypothetical protein
MEENGANRSAVPKEKAKGAGLVFVGYMLSPLSWWNDAFVNIPIAYLFAFLVGLFSKKLFLPSMVFGYWVTNIVGLVLMHKGTVKIATGEKKNYTGKAFLRDLLISIVYSLLMLMLVELEILRFPLDYFGQASP